MFQKYSNEALFYQYNKSLMLLLPTTSILRCRRWFANCLNIKFTLALSNHIFELEKMVWQWGHFSLLKVFSFSNLSKISLEMQDSALLFPTWRIKRQGFLSSIDARLCCISSLVASGKLQTLTTPYLPDKRSSRIPFIIECPAVTDVFKRYWPWIVVVSQISSHVLSFLLNLKAL